MNLKADTWVGQPGRRRSRAQRKAQPKLRIITVQFTIPSEASLLHRWNLSVTRLQRRSAKGIGPSAWRIGKHLRDLACEVDWIERHAQFRRRSDEADFLSEFLLRRRKKPSSKRPSAGRDRWRGDVHGT